MDIMDVIIVNKNVRYTLQSFFICFLLSVISPAKLKKAYTAVVNNAKTIFSHNKTVILFFSFMHIYAK